MLDDDADRRRRAGRRARAGPARDAPAAGAHREATSWTPARGGSSTVTRRSLDRECMGLVVAAMTMPHVLDRLIEGGVVIVPGDREDVVIGVLLAHRSKTFPSLSGIVLNGGFPLPPQVERLIEGLDVVLPVIATDGGTMATASSLGRGARPAHPGVHPQARRRRRHGRARARRRGAPRPGRDRPVAGPSRPLMFEHRLVDAARAAGRAHRPARGRRGPDPARRRHACSPGASPGSPCSATRRPSAPTPPGSGVDISARARSSTRPPAPCEKASRRSTPSCAPTRA